MSNNINDKATVSLFVNGEQAEDAMERLRKKAADLDKQLQDAMDAGKKKDARKLRKEIESVQKELNRTESAAKGTGIVLNDLSNSSIHGLRNALKYLKNELKMTKPDTEAWRNYAEQIKRVQGRIDELNEELKGSQSTWSKFKDWALGAWPAIDLLTQWGGAVVDAGRKAVDAFASMDQEMANVRKFTGMTSEDVETLNEAFKGIDTRSSREDLNKLAQEAGRLGKTSQEDVLGFVRAADKINVALDDLGEGATLTLSKLTGIFGDEKRYGTEQSLLKVGSVINELSQNCSASAPYLAEFASRMGGVGAQAGMTIQQIMGFGAVLDSNEQKVEASSTALSQVIVRMMQEPAKYAKVAGLDVKKFSDMIKTDTNGALLLFLDTLQKAGGMDVLSPMFKDMGENGSRAISALSTLATHIDEVKAQQEAANVAFKEGTSIDKEFNVQNTTVQASLEKAQKAVNEIRVELGQKLAPVMSHIISSSSALLRVLASTVSFIYDNKTAIISTTAAIAAYSIAVNFAAIKTKALVVLQKVWNATLAVGKFLLSPFQLAIAGVTNAVQYFTNGMQVNYAMQQRWHKALAATNWVALTAAIVAAAAALLIFRNRTNNVVEAQKALNDIKTDAEKKLTDEKNKIDLLVQAARNEKLSLDERQKAVNALNKIIPNYNAQLDATTGKYRANKKALDQYLASLRKKYELEGAKEKLAEIGKKKADLAIQRQQAQDELNVEKQINANLNATNSSGFASPKTSSSGFVPTQVFGQMGTSSRQNSLEMKIDNIDKKLQTEDAKADAIMKIYGEELQKQEVNSAQEEQQANFQSGEDSGTGSGSGTGYTSKIQAEKDAKKAQAAARAAAVKAKKEFKEQLDQIKAARDKEQTEIMALRMTGEINYLEYNKRKLAADEKYYDDSIALYEKWGIQEDDQCQALARKREEFLSKANEQRLAIDKEAIQRTAQAEERDIKARYAYKSSHTLAEELKLEEELLTIRFNALMDQQELYKKTDKEYEEYQRQIDDLFLKDQESKQQKIMAKVEEFRKRFEYQPVSVKYDMERAAIEELYRIKKIKEEEYQKWLKKLNEQTKEETKKEKDDLPGMQPPKNNFTNAAEALAKYKNQKQELDEALNKGIINESEYQTALRRIKAELRKSLIYPLKECKSEWVSMMATMADSWADFADALKDPNGNPFDALGEAITATSAVVMSVMSTVTEFQKAEYEIQAAEVKKRYDAEIDAAQGNSYRVRRLEKEREKELANMKSEQSKKQFAMQVIQAVAQTATNALNAYGSAAAIPVVGHVLAPIAAAIAVAQGAVQIELIKKQQQAAEAQGYSQGGFTKPGAVNEPAGIVHAGEWVASQKLLANPVARPMIEALDYAQRTNTIGSLKDEDVSRSIRANDSMVRIAESGESSALMVAAVAQNAEAMAALNERLRRPIDAAVSVAGEHGIVAAEDKYKAYIKNKSPKKFS